MAAKVTGLGNGYGILARSAGQFRTSQALRMGRTNGQNAPERQGVKRPDRRGATCRSPARDTSEIGFPIGLVYKDAASGAAK
jgi:hypothetical protein